jgi:hypothetical protein
MRERRREPLMISGMLSVMCLGSYHCGAVPIEWECME